MDFTCLENVSKEEITPIVWSTQNLNRTREHTTNNGYVCASVAVFILLIGTPLNLFVVGAIIWNKLYKSTAIIPMLNLAISNVLVCIVILPFIIVSGFSTGFVFGSSDFVRCKICAIGAANVTLPFVSMYTLSVMSVSRLLYLKFPVKYDSIVTHTRMTIVTIGVWIFCFAISLPPFFGFGSVQFAYVVATCVPLVVGESPIVPNLYYIIMLVVMAAVPIAVIVLMYVWIVCIARKYIVMNPKKFVAVNEERSARNISLTNYRIHEDNSEKIINETIKKKQFRLVQVLGAIILANVVTWIPVILLGIAGAATGPTRLPTVFYSVSYLCYLLEVIIHPLLQILLLYELKETVAKIFRSVKKMMYSVNRRFMTLEHEEGSSM